MFQSHSFTDHIQIINILVIFISSSLVIIIFTWTSPLYPPSLSLFLLFPFTLHFDPFSVHPVAILPLSPYTKPPPCRSPSYFYSPSLLTVLVSPCLPSPPLSLPPCLHMLYLSQFAFAFHFSLTATFTSNISVTLQNFKLAASTRPH